MTKETIPSQEIPEPIKPPSSDEIWWKELQEKWRKEEKEQFDGKETGIIPADKDAKPRIIVEIGGGSNPVVASEFRKVFSNETYYNVEMQCQNYYRENSTVRVRNLRREALYHFVDMDEETPNFPDGSVDELVFTNVFGDPNTTKEGHRVDVLYRLLEEANRKLVPSGRIVITEVIEPVFPKEKLKEIIAEKHPDLNIEETNDAGAVAEYVNIHPLKFKSVQGFDPNYYQLILTRKQN